MPFSEAQGSSTPSDSVFWIEHPARESPMMTEVNFTVLGIFIEWISETNDSGKYSKDSTNLIFDLIEPRQETAISGKTDDGRL